jgi:hypothetical protein
VLALVVRGLIVAVGGVLGASVRMGKVYTLNNFQKSSKKHVYEL